MRYALSVWGNPQLLSLPPSSTAKGIQDVTKQFPDLPVFLEDFQVLDNRGRDVAPEIIYAMGTGQRRVTSSKSQTAVGGEWRYGVGLYAAERRLTQTWSLGAQLRVWELDGWPLSDATAAAAVSESARLAYGACADALGRIYQERGATLASRAAEAASRYSQEHDLRGDDGSTLAVIQVGLELIAEITRLTLDVPTIMAKAAKRLEAARKGARDISNVALAALCEKVLNNRWPENGHMLVVQEENVAAKIVDAATGSLLYLDVNTRSRPAVEVLRDYGGEARLVVSWMRAGLTVAPSGYAKVQSRQFGARVVRVTREFLEGEGLVERYVKSTSAVEEGGKL
jgi:hypothetical protein